MTLTELRAIQPKAGGGFTAATVWSGRARAGHWGHAHRREIVFEGLVDIASEEGYWKIDGLTVTDKAILD